MVAWGNIDKCNPNDQPIEYLNIASTALRESDFCSVQDVAVEQPESLGKERRWEGRDVVGPHSDSLLIDQITSTV